MTIVITCTPAPAPRRAITTNPQAAQEIAYALFARLRKPTTTVQRQQAIENALSVALYHVRHDGGNIRTAAAKAIRAASMLKQACAEGEVSHV